MEITYRTPLLRIIDFDAEVSAGNPSTYTARGMNRGVVNHFFFFTRLISMYIALFFFFGRPFRNLFVGPGRDCWLFYDPVKLLITLAAIFRPYITSKNRVGTTHSSPTVIPPSRAFENIKFEYRSGTIWIFLRSPFRFDRVTTAVRFIGSRQKIQFIDTYTAWYGHGVSWNEKLLTLEIIFL